MDTLLIADHNAALIGERHGGTRTEQRPQEQTPEEWFRWLRHNFRECGHWEKGAEQVPFTKHGALRQVSPIEGYIETTEEYFPVEEFSDTSVGLTVRAAFITPTNMWVVADAE